MPKDDERCSWMIGDFPRDVKNKFMALAKIDNKTAPEYLEYVLNKFFREEKQKEKKADVEKT